VKPDEGILGAVFGILTVSNHRPCDAIRPLLVPLDQQIKGSHILFGDSPAKVFIGRLGGLH